MSWLISPVGGVPALSNVGDVTIVSIAAGEIIKWSGAAWLNNTLAEANIQEVITDTTSNLANISNAINTGAKKVAGFMVFNTTTSKPVWALGNTDGSLWVDATGATVHTPA